MGMISASETQQYRIPAVFRPDRLHAAPLAYRERQLAGERGDKPLPFQPSAAAVAPNPTGQRHKAIQQPGWCCIHRPSPRTAVK